MERSEYLANLALATEKPTWQRPSPHVYRPAVRLPRPLAWLWSLL